VCRGGSGRRLPDASSEGRIRNTVMHYPHKKSNIKRARKIGFRARMKTKKGRQMISRKRRAGRKLNVV
jgi:large subunit ribosomal protein L34